MLSRNEGCAIERDRMESRGNWLADLHAVTALKQCKVNDYKWRTVQLEKVRKDDFCHEGEKVQEKR